MLLLRWISCPIRIAGKSLAEMEKIDGIGKSTAAKIIELLETGAITELTELICGHTRRHR